MADTDPSPVNGLYEIISDTYRGKIVKGRILYKYRVIVNKQLHLNLVEFISLFSLDTTELH